MTTTTTRLLGGLAAATMLFAACGSDDDGGAGGDQGAAADLLVDAVGEEGVELDRDCVNDIAGELSDDDAAAIVAAGPDGDPDISPEAEALGGRILNECLDLSSAIDAILAEIGDDDGIDKDCLRTELEKATNFEEVQTLAVSAALECVSI